MRAHLGIVEQPGNSLGIVQTCQQARHTFAQRLTDWLGVSAAVESKICNQLACFVALAGQAALRIVIEHHKPFDGKAVGL
ncbi:hypothetical protein D3C78_1541490 [compost metagenome]